MAGHSRWAQIKHKKTASDQKKGELFSKFARLVTLAARTGGANPEENVRLRDAILKARQAGMGQETIERAIGRASAPAAGRELAAASYEAYGPGGIAILIETITDNTNRTHQELRELLGRFGGKLAEPGAVRWLFERRLVFDIARPADAAEKLEYLLIDAGAEEIGQAADRIVAVVDPNAADGFRAKLTATGVPILESSYEYIPKTRTSLDQESHGELEKLLDALDGHADVQEIYTNADL